MDSPWRLSNLPSTFDTSQQTHHLHKIKFL
jgi:hypothetical protein